MGLLNKQNYETLSGRYNSPDSMIHSIGLGSPAAASATGALAATALTASPQTITTGLTNPDVPRNATVTGNASGIAGNAVVNGLNDEGVTISETIALNGTATVAGNKAFASIISVQLPVQTHGSGDTVSVGFGTKLGIGVRLSRDSTVAAYNNGVKESSAPTVTFDPVTFENNTITLASTLAGHPIIVDFYRS
jgi:hypothetical protein